MSKNNNNNEEKLSAKEKREIIKRTLKAVRVADSGYLIRDTIEYRYHTFTALDCCS